PVLATSHEEVDGAERPGRNDDAFAAKLASSMEEARRPLGGDHVPTFVERSNVDDARLGENLGSTLLCKIQVILIERVLGLVPTADHACAAADAAGAVGALAAEERIRNRLARLAEVDADGRAMKRVAATEIIGDLFQQAIGFDEGFARHRTEHAPRSVVVRSELLLPVEADPLRFIEGLRRRLQQRVRIPETAAADAYSVKEEDVTQHRDLQ